jgi:hypothetical protein
MHGQPAANWAVCVWAYLLYTVLPEEETKQHYDKNYNL